MRVSVSRVQKEVATLAPPSVLLTHQSPVTARLATSPLRQPPETSQKLTLDLLLSESANYTGEFENLTSFVSIKVYLYKVLIR